MLNGAVSGFVPANTHDFSAPAKDETARRLLLKTQDPRLKAVST
jgi:hypothetical protein